MRKDNAGICATITHITSAMPIDLTNDTYNNCAFVAVNVSSPSALIDPIEAAAMICTAHPQSIEAIAAIEPTVFASANRV